MSDLNTTASTPDLTANGPQSGAETPPVNAGGETARTFTQAELNEIIKQRLSKYADYEDLRVYKQQAEESRLSDVEKLSKQLDEYKPYKDVATRQTALLEEMLQQELEAVPNEYKSLIPEDFDTFQKLNYLRKNKNVFFKQPASPPPNTPVEPNRTATKPGLYGGKYESLVDFQAKDPKGYGIWRKSQGL